MGEAEVNADKPRDRTLAILSYHRVGPPPGGWETWFCVPESVFAEQLRHLRANVWCVVDVVTLLRGLTDPDSLPERTALITFDDGFRSVSKYALPWLRTFGYPAVLFIPTAFIGRRNWFDRDWEPQEAICDWDDLRELERNGVSIQSHGVSHRQFSGLDPAEQEEELVRSKATLEDGLAKSIEVFAFPYGDAGPHPPMVKAALERAGYRAACTYGGGPITTPIEDPYHLPRLAMGPDTNLELELGLVCLPGHAP